MSNKEEKSKEHKKKNKYIVKDKDGNILPVSYTHLTLPTT